MVFTLSSSSGSVLTRVPSLLKQILLQSVNVNKYKGTLVSREGSLYVNRKARPSHEGFSTVQHQTKRKKNGNTTSLKH